MFITSRGICDLSCTVLIGVLSILLCCSFKLILRWVLLAPLNFYYCLIVGDVFDVCVVNVFQSLITVLGMNEYTPGSD